MTLIVLGERDEVERLPPLRRQRGTRVGGGQPMQRHVNFFAPAVVSGNRARGGHRVAARELSSARLVSPGSSGDADR